MDETFSHTEGGGTKNHLELRPLRREDLGRKLTCAADNTGGREVQEASVWIDMICKHKQDMYRVTHQVVFLVPLTSKQKLRISIRNRY